MKWIHTSDLHIGKMFNDFSLIEDQRYFFGRLIALAEKEHADAVILAGDLYDRSVPSAEAVALLNDFLCQMTMDKKIPVLAIAGNHDSPQRLDFGSQLMRSAGLHLVGSYRKTFEKVTLQDEYGPVHFYLSPYLEPALVRVDFPDDSIRSYDDAFTCVMRENRAQIDFDSRNVFVGHGFFSYLKDPDSVARSESEVSLGGSDLIDAAPLADFDYVALGHIHRPQMTGKEHIRYSGSPLPYSLSEIPFEKSVCVVELKEKGDLSIREIPLVPLRDMKEIKGTYNELTLKEYYDRDPEMKEAYLHITLTDEEDVPDAAAKLRVIYPNLMKLDYDNTRTRNTRGVQALTEVEKKTPMELFSAFYEMQNGQEMSLEQKQYLETLIEGIWEGDA